MDNISPRDKSKNVCWLMMSCSCGHEPGRGAAQSGERARGCTWISQRALSAFGEINYTLSKLRFLPEDLNRTRASCTGSSPMSCDSVFARRRPLPRRRRSLFATFLHRLQFSREQFIIICWRNCLECRSFDQVVFSALHLFCVCAALLPQSHYLGTAGDASTL